MNHLIWFLLYLLTYIQVRSYLLLRERHIFCGWANFSVKTYHNGHIHSNFFAHTKTHRDANRVLGYKTSKWSECTLTGSGGRFHKFSDHHTQSWGNTFPCQILVVSWRTRRVTLTLSCSTHCSTQKRKIPVKGCAMIAPLQALDSGNFSR